MPADVQRKGNEERQLAVFYIFRCLILSLRLPFVAVSSATAEIYGIAEIAVNTAAAKANSLYFRQKLLPSKNIVYL